jgi:hypothetical protein
MKKKGKVGSLPLSHLSLRNDKSAPATPQILNPAATMRA